MNAVISILSLRDLRRRQNRRKLPPFTIDETGGLFLLVILGHVAFVALAVVAHYFFS